MIYHYKVQNIAKAQAPKGKKEKKGGHRSKKHQCLLFIYMVDANQQHTKIMACRC
jgi:hypothetical protein